MFYMKKKPKKPKPPEVKPPPPVQDVQVTDNSAKRAEAQRRRQGGVASTALTETLG